MYCVFIVIDSQWGVFNFSPSHQRGFKITFKKFVNLKLKENELGDGDGNFRRLKPFTSLLKDSFFVIELVSDIFLFASSCKEMPWGSSFLLYPKRSGVFKPKPNSKDLFTGEAEAEIEGMIFRLVMAKKKYEFYFVIYSKIT